MNTLYYGDNLEVLQTAIAPNTVDLVYIDPPFNSKRNYNMFLDDKEIQAQRVAFEDTWTFKNVQVSFGELNRPQTSGVFKLLTAYQEAAPFAFPYLVMMARRIIELHRVLKQTGSFYLHCDPTMSHYLKTLCDSIFGQKRFLNEVIWCYNVGGKSKKHWARKHDVILYYSKSANYFFDGKSVGISRDTGTKSFGGKMGVDADGRPYQDKLVKETGKYYRYYLDEPKIPEDWWTDINSLQSKSDERLGYPTQKPRALLERILKASSREGDVVLDAFCGCGTTIDAAEALNRNWIGIDISPIAINLIEQRLKKTYLDKLSSYQLLGLPMDEEEGIELWRKNKFAFQDWWITKFEVFSTTFGTQGADQGLDGIAVYAIDRSGGTARAAFQVKGGTNIQDKDIRDLRGAMELHNCELGVFLTINPPTSAMLQSAARSGYVELIPGLTYPRLQILTLREYFEGKRPKLPSANITFKQAAYGAEQSEQLGFEEVE